MSNLSLEERVQNFNTEIASHHPIAMFGEPIERIYKIDVRNHRSENKVRLCFLNINELPISLADYIENTFNRYFPNYDGTPISRIIPCSD